MDLKALVVIDMQEDFVNGALANEAAQDIEPEICIAIRDHIEAGQPVIFTRDTHYDDYMETLEAKKLPIPHCIHDTPGWQLTEAILQTLDMCDAIEGQHYIIIDKDTFGAYDLAEEIEDFIGEEFGYDDELTSLTFVGVCTGICVISNVAIARAHFPECPIYVRADACACVTPETHRQALEAMKVFQIDVTEA